jgi:hypothetical protein
MRKSPRTCAPSSCVRVITFAEGGTCATALPQARTDLWSRKQALIWTAIGSAYVAATTQLMRSESDSRDAPKTRAGPRMAGWAAQVCSPTANCP